MTKKSKDAKVQGFLEETMMVDDSKYQILQAMRKVVFQHYPKAKERMMYGGIIFSLASDWGGIFVYKNHLSFEFSLGYKLKDPKQLLEGGGKFRRHLKMKSLDDIKGRNLDFFIKQIEGLEE